jgi:signal transduction histidine kinase
MVQEALTNVARHAHASEVCIELRQSGGELRLTVTDNGAGFDEAAAFREGSHGLMGIRERAHMLGGTLGVGESPQGGARVSVRLPLRAAAVPAKEWRGLSEPPAPPRRRHRRTKDTP